MICYVDIECHGWWSHLFPIPRLGIHQAQLRDGQRMLDKVLDIAGTLACDR